VLVVAPFISLITSARRMGRPMFTQGSTSSIFTPYDSGSRRHGPAASTGTRCHEQAGRSRRCE
jgi:hypothetical protein